MKSDNSIKEIIIATINRKAMNSENWLFSKIAFDNQHVDFLLELDELPIFIIESQKTKTLITSRRILENESGKLKSIRFGEIDDVIYGDFKKQKNRPEISKFRIVDIFGDQYDFQMETGKASIGLIYSVNTIIKLNASR